MITSRCSRKWVHALPHFRGGTKTGLERMAEITVFLFLFLICIIIYMAAGIFRNDAFSKPSWLWEEKTKYIVYYMLSRILTLPDLLSSETSKPEGFPKKIQLKTQRLVLQTWRFPKIIIIIIIIVFQHSHNSLYFVLELWDRKTIHQTKRLTVKLWELAGLHCFPYLHLFLSIIKFAVIWSNTCNKRTYMYETQRS